MNLEELNKSKSHCLAYFKEELEEIERSIIGIRENSEWEEDEEALQDYQDMENQSLEDLELLKNKAINGPDFLNKEYSISYELLKDDKDYVLNLYKLWPHFLVEYDYNIIYDIASSRLIQSIEFIKEIFELDESKDVTWEWSDFPKTFWKDKTFVELAVKIDKEETIQYADKSLLNDPLTIHKKNMNTSEQELFTMCFDELNAPVKKLFISKDSITRTVEFYENRVKTKYPNEKMNIELVIIELYTIFDL